MFIVSDIESLKGNLNTMLYEVFNHLSNLGLTSVFYSHFLECMLFRCFGRIIL